MAGLSEGHKARVTLERTADLLVRLGSAGDRARIAELYDQVVAGPLAPHAVGDVLEPADASLGCGYLEAWRDAVLSAWFGPKAPAAAWRELLLPGARGFARPGLLMLAVALRRFGSARLGGAPLPPERARAGLDAHAQGVAALVLSTDGVTMVDYEALVACVDPMLHPALVLWALGVYAVSPQVSVTPATREHQRTLMEAFARVHRDLHVAVPPLTHATTAAAFRASYLLEDPRPLLEVLVDGFVAPEPPRARQAYPPAGRRDAEAGVLLSSWGEHRTVHRCVAPLLEPLRAAGVRAYWCAGTPAEARVVLPEAWRSAPVRLAAIPAADAEGLVRAAERIRADRLDFLYFTEVGLTVPSRWLGSRRLARVQATGYGHPVTTGSPAMDYYVGGAAVERPGARYRERLVLVPGLGVDTAPPPPPREPPAERDPGEPPRLVSLASLDKLNPDLLAALGAITAATGARLQLFPSTPPALRPVVEALVRAHVPDVEITWQASREDCIDALAGADLYLDSYPFGGYNTSVEALATGCPVVTIEGMHAYQRFTAAMLRMLELPEVLVAGSFVEYVQAALRVLRDGGLRSEVRARLDRERVIATLCDTDAPSHFQAAVDWMRRTGPSRRGPPVLVRAGEAPQALDGWG